MKRRLCGLLLAGLLPLLLGAAVNPLRIEPDPPRLGTPLQITVQLPGTDWQLSDYPDLRPFRLLGQPVIEEDRLRLTLLPMRPGPARLPEFPLYKGSRSWNSPTRTIDIEDPYRDIRQPSALHPLLTGERLSGAWWWGLLPATAAAGLLLMRKHRAGPTDAGGSRFADMAVQLETLPPGEGKTQLQELLTAWRFGPYPPTGEELNAWRERLADLETEE
ncbi:hypothetical protein C2E25_03120 [Geothermobacter hydrogeniphilus]|uniref:Uncharacterized protein n=1 Tax=Geothermobacter hydrogeniphilus TaxID=1969733 RepID=A0A2K2HDC6_9BACT|nr:hypothetical protein [Geothermobacter hydrogeniphilus]PNU21298.1 hypothetical protein C2E25_03120 [Geothermobacter hydrogeniphilus]